MGNDNEIRQLIRHESESSLKIALDKSKDVVKTYNFDVEFAKTRANKSFVVIGATIITIIVLAVAAFAITKAIERNIAAAPVDISAFEDLNLKDILDTSKRNASDMERAKVEMTQLQEDLNSTLAAVDRDTQSSIESIRARAAGPADEQEKVAAANSAAAAKKQQLRANFAAASARKRAEIAVIQKRIEQYDSRAVDQAKKQEAFLQNERMVFDIEKKKQADLYTARIAELEKARISDAAEFKRQKEELAASLTSRYNPTYVDPRSQSLLQNVKSGPSDKTGPVTFHPYLITAGVLDEPSMTGLDRSFSDFEYLSAKLRAVPYINSVPPSLSRIESEARASIVSYRAALAAAGSGLEARDARIAALEARAAAAEASLEQFRWAVSSFARESRESGYVIDARNPAKIITYIDPTVPVAEGATGYVVRGDKSVATLTFHVEAGRVTANVSRLESGETLLAFDSILVDASREAGK
jgi:hypothetical protein